MRVTDVDLVKRIARMLGVKDSSMLDGLTSTPQVSGNRKILMNPLTHEKVCI